MSTIQVDIEEAKAILQAALDADPTSRGTKFDSFPPEMQIQAISGVINVVKGLQVLGYRIMKPFKAV